MESLYQNYHLYGVEQNNVAISSFHIVVFRLQGRVCDNNVDLFQKWGG